jgi:undecaprenyl-diphosphatase
MVPTEKLDLKADSYPASPLNRLRTYLLTFAIFWLVGGVMLWLWGYEGSFLKLNALRTDWADALMPHLTHLGDGLLISVLVGLFLVRKSPELVLSLIVGMLLVAVCTYIGKFWLFREWHRPVIVFLHRVPIYEISLTRLFHYSFPSGHSAAVAAALTYLAYFWGEKRPLAGILLACLAALVCYTRLYIGVHFLGDIVVGSILGTSLAGLSLWLLPARLSNWMHRPPVLRWQRFQKGLSWLAYTLLPLSVGWVYYTEYLR